MAKKVSYAQQLRQFDRDIGARVALVEVLRIFDNSPIAALRSHLDRQIHWHQQRTLRVPVRPRRATRP